MKPVNADSLLIPLIMELDCLAEGVHTFSVLQSKIFSLHTHLILVFGDIPSLYAHADERPQWCITAQTTPTYPQTPHKSLTLPTFPCTFSKCSLLRLVKSNLQL